MINCYFLHIGILQKWHVKKYIDIIYRYDIEENIMNYLKYLSYSTFIHHTPYRRQGAVFIFFLFWGEPLTQGLKTKCFCFKLFTCCGADVVADGYDQDKMDLAQYIYNILIFYIHKCTYTYTYIYNDTYIKRSQYGWTVFFSGIRRFVSYNIFTCGNLG